MAALGQFVLFFSVLTATVIVGGFALTYAAHSFLTVVEGTAAGGDEVHWPDEPILDWLGKPILLAWLLALPIVAAEGLLLLLYPEFLDEPVATPLLVFAGVWLIFPIFLLSSLSGKTRLAFLHWGLLRRLVRHPLALALFYFFSGPLVLVGGGLLYGAVFLPTWFLLPVAVPVAAAVMLIYGRLLGRIGWLVGFRTPEPPAKKKRRKRLRAVAAHDPWPPADQPVAASSPRHDATPGKPAIAITVLDPWAVSEPVSAQVPDGVTEEEEDEWTPNKKPYPFAEYKPAPPKKEQESPPPSMPGALGEEEDEWTPNKKPYTFLDEKVSAKGKQLPASTRAEGYRSSSDAFTAPPGSPDSYSSAPIPPLPPADDFSRGDTAADRDVSLPSLEDRVVLVPRRRPPPPAWPLFSGVWNFPLYPTCLQALTYLSATGILLGVLVRCLFILGAIDG